MTSTPQQHLTTVIRHWGDLTEALGTPPVVGGFGIGLRGYLAHLAAMDRAEQAERARELRLLERDPAQLGERPIPIRVAIFDTMQAVHADLLACADAIAAAVQRAPMAQLPASYPEADRARRAVLAMKDAHDPRRWKWTGKRPTAPYTALWLLGRVQGAPGPFQPLTEAHSRFIATTARRAAQRVETALDIAAHVAPINRPCPHCSGHINIHGGAGTSPTAHCTRCGHTWTTAAVA